MRNATAWLTAKGADYLRRAYEAEGLHYDGAGDRAAAVLLSRIAALEGQGPITPAVVQKARCGLGLVAYRSERGKRPSAEALPPTEPPAVLPFPAPREDASFAAEMKGARDRDERIAKALEGQERALWAIRDVLARKPARGPLDALLDDFRAWARVTFPHSTPASCVAHLVREVEELRQNPTDPGEIADCIFLVVDAAQRAGLHLTTLLAKKLARCKERKWGTPDAEGVVEHVRDADQYRRGYDHATGSTILEHRPAEAAK